MLVELRAPDSAEDWAAYHDIRKRILFDARGRGDAYDPAHPDETASENHPLILDVDGKPVGVVRIDLDLPDAWLRRMAVDTPYQRRGYGQRMIGEIVSFCRDAGAGRILSLVASDAIGFYAKCGFEPVPGMPVDGTPRMMLTLPADD